jgi:hypothetical protein
MYKLQKMVLFFVLLVTSTYSSAALLQITATSGTSGELGYFVVDDAILATDTSLVASQFYDYYFADPLSGYEITPSDVVSDSGVTYFSQIGGVWTVTGGGGDSLTDTNGDGVWIALDYYLDFTVSGGGTYDDVSWSTKDYAPVPIPAAAWLLGSGLLGLIGLSRRNKATA